MTRKKVGCPLVRIRNYMKRLPYLFLIIAILAAACSKETKKTEVKKAKADDSASLKVALVPISATIPFYVAQQLGIYDSLKADIKLIRYGAAIDADTAFANATVDGMSTDVVRAILLNNKRGLYFVMALENKYTLITPHDLRLKNVKDIKERLIAMTRYSAVDYIVDKSLATAKYGPEDANKVQINNLVIRLQMLQNTQVDAALLPDPYAQLPLIAGDRAIVSSSDLSVCTDGMIFSKESISKKEEQIRNLIKGYNIAVEYMNSHPYKEWSKYAAKHLGMEQNVVDTLSIKGHVAVKMQQKDIDAPLEWMKGKKLIDKKASAPQLTNDKFVE